MERSTAIIKLDPRIKLLVLAAVAWLALYMTDPLKLLVLTVSCLGIMYYSQVKLSDLWRDILPMAILLVAFSLIGAFLDPRQPGIGIGPLYLSYPGVKTALLVSWRVLIILGWACWFTVSTTIREMSMTLEWVLIPLQRLGFNTSALVLSVVVALRFIPELLNEGRLIREAQQLRGYSEKSNRPTAAAKGLLVIIVPLLIRTWMRAEELADAIMARGYRSGHPPKRINTLRLSRLDVGVIIGVLAFGCWAVL